MWFIIFCSQVVFSPFLVNPDLLHGGPDPFKLVPVTTPPDSITIGSLLYNKNAPMQFWVKNEKGFSLSNQRVEVDIQVQMYNSENAVNWCSMNLEGHTPFENNKYGLYGARYREICSARFNGSAVRYTDADGLVSFDDFRPVDMLPGLYTLTVAVKEEGETTTDSNLYQQYGLTLISEVAKVSSVEDEPVALCVSSASPNIGFGNSNSDTVQLLVSDGRGHALANKTVFLVSAAKGSLEFYFRPGDAFVLFNQTSALTNQEGIATFSHVSLLGYNHRRAFVPAFFCEGVVFAPSPNGPLYPLVDVEMSDVTEVIVTSIPTQVVEGENFSVHVRTLAQSGPISGRTVFAAITSSYGASYDSDFRQSDFNTNYFDKFLSRPWSVTPTDAHGNAELVLSFTRNYYAGEFGLRFSAEGVQSDEHTITVISSVEKLVLDTQPACSWCPTHYLQPLTGKCSRTFCRTGYALTTSPSILISDAQEQFLSTKAITSIEAVPTNPSLPRAVLYYSTALLTVVRSRFLAQSLYVLAATHEADYRLNITVDSTSILSSPFSAYVPSDTQSQCGTILPLTAVPEEVVFDQPWPGTIALQAQNRAQKVVSAFSKTAYLCAQLVQDEIVSKKPDSSTFMRHAYTLLSSCRRLTGPNVELGPIVLDKAMDAVFALKEGNTYNVRFVALPALPTKIDAGYDELFAPPCVSELFSFSLKRQHYAISIASTHSQDNVLSICNQIDVVFQTAQSPPLTLTLEATNTSTHSPLEGEFIHTTFRRLYRLEDNHVVEDESSVHSITDLMGNVQCNGTTNSTGQVDIVWDMPLPHIGWATVTLDHALFHSRGHMIERSLQDAKLTLLQDYASKNKSVALGATIPGHFSVQFSAAGVDETAGFELIVLPVALNAVLNDDPTGDIFGAFANPRVVTGPSGSVTFSDLVLLETPANTLQVVPCVTLADYSTFVCSNATLTVTESVAVVIVNEPSTTATLGGVLISQPKITAFLSTGEVVTAALSVQAHLVDADGNPVDAGLGGDKATLTKGVATFTSLRFTHSTPGEYRMAFVVAGTYASPLSVPITLTTTATALDIQGTSITSDSIAGCASEGQILTGGRPIAIVVMATATGGVGVPSRAVTATIQPAGLEACPLCLLQAAALGLTPHECPCSLATRAEYGGRPGAMLREAAAVTATTSPGQAILMPVISAALQGWYKIVVASDAATVATVPFYVHNLVERLNLTLAPQPLDSDSVSRRCTTLGRASSLQQPVLTVLLKHNHGLYIPPDVNLFGEEVVVTAFSKQRSSWKESSSAILLYTPSTTQPDSSGTVTFTDLRFSVASTGVYRLHFSYMGVSVLSEPIRVYNPSEPDTSSLGNLQTLLYSSALVMTPVLMANRLTTTSRIITLYIALATALAYALVFVFSIFYSPNFNLREYYQVILIGVCIFVSGAVAVVVAHLVYRDKRKAKLLQRRARAAKARSGGEASLERGLTASKEKLVLGEEGEGEEEEEEEEDRSSSSLFFMRESDRLLVNLLLNKHAKEEIVYTKMERLRTTWALKLGLTTRTEVQYILYPKARVNMDPPFPPRKAMPLTDEEACSMAVVPKMKLLIKRTFWSLIRSLLLPAPISPHRVYEQYGIKYSQRFLTTAGVSLWICFLLYLVIMMGAQFFGFEMEKMLNILRLYNLQMDAEVQKNSQEINTDLHMAAHLFNQTGYQPSQLPSAMTLVLGRIFSTLFDPDSTPSDAMIQAMNNLYQDSEETVHLLVAAVTAALLTGGFVAFAVTVVVWLLMFAAYKEKIFYLRQGKYWFGNMDLYPLKNSPLYLGLHLSHVLISFVLVFLIVSIICFCLFFKPLTSRLTPYVWTILLLLTTGSFWLKLVLARVGDFVTDGKQKVLHPILYSVYDFLTLLSNIPGGFAAAIGGIVSALVALVIRFARLDSPRAPSPDHPDADGSHHAQDKGYSIYLSALLSDYRQHNPVVSVACFLLLRPVELKRIAEHRVVGQEYDRECGLIRGRRPPPATPNFTDCNDAVKTPECSTFSLVTATDPQHRVRLKWQKLLTLARNPSIAPTSKKHNPDAFKYLQIALESSGSSSSSDNVDNAKNHDDGDVSQDKELFLEEKE